MRSTKAADSVMKARAEDRRGTCSTPCRRCRAPLPKRKRDKSKFPMALKTWRRRRSKLGIADPSRCQGDGHGCRDGDRKDENCRRRSASGPPPAFVFTSKRPGRQDAIFSQMVSAGLPEMLSGPLRCDAAQRWMQPER